MTAITIAIVDDHPLFREGVSRSLSEIENFVVVGEGASADDAAALAVSHMPDFLLLDVSMPGGGIEAISKIVVRSPRTKVLMLTASEDVDPLVAALRRGAAGYVVKGIGSRADLPRPSERASEARDISRRPCVPRSIKLFSTDRLHSLAAKPRWQNW